MTSRGPNFRAPSPPPLVDSKFSLISLLHPHLPFSNSPSFDLSSEMVYKLYYFDGRGVGEPARQLFALAGEKFEDVRYTDDTWPSHKAGKDREMISENLGASSGLISEFRTALRTAARVGGEWTENCPIWSHLPLPGKGIRLVNLPSLIRDRCHPWAVPLSPSDTINHLFPQDSPARTRSNKPLLTRSLSCTRTTRGTSTTLSTLPVDGRRGIG